jgi:hypothetical protein
MKPALSACERCGLREVRHELEKKGVIIRFCDECYWGEISEPGAARDSAAAEGTAATSPGSTRKTA